MAGIGSSKLKVTIRESITLNNNKYDSLITKEIANINEVSKRIVTVPGDQSKRELLNVSGSIGAGSYLTSDVQYMRFTNLENEATGTGEGTLDLIFKNSNNDEFTVKLDHGQTFIYPGMEKLTSSSIDETDGTTIVHTVRTGGVSGSMSAIDADIVNPDTNGSLTHVIAEASGSSIDLELFIAST